MTTFAILFEDDDAYAGKRQQFMSDHLDFLERNASSIQAAGPLKIAVDQTPSGGLWVVQAESLDEVQLIVEQDPFWPTGLRKSVTILEWTQVFSDGKRSV